MVYWLRTNEVSEFLKFVKKKFPYTVQKVQRRPGPARPGPATPMFNRLYLGPKSFLLIRTNTDGGDMSWLQYAKVLDTTS